MKTACVTLAALLLFGTDAIAGGPEAFCVARDAWTCDGPPSIERIEQLHQHGDPASGSDEARESFEISRGANCIDYPWLSDEGRTLVDNRITVMYLDRKFAYFGRKYTYRPDQRQGGPEVQFGCSWALISDIRDLSWRRVNRERLSKAAAVTTMADVAEATFCPADYPK